MKARIYSVQSYYLLQIYFWISIRCSMLRKYNFYLYNFNAAMISIWSLLNKWNKADCYWLYFGILFCSSKTISLRAFYISNYFLFSAIFYNYYIFFYLPFYFKYFIFRFLLISTRFLYALMACDSALRLTATHLSLSLWDLSYLNRKRTSFSTYGAIISFVFFNSSRTSFKSSTL